MIEIIGMIAAVLSTFSVIPQVYKTWKTKSAEDLSYGTLLFLFVELILWLVYGLMLSSIPLIFSNIVASVAIFIVIILKIKDQRKAIPVK